MGGLHGTVGRRENSAHTACHKPHVLDHWRWSDVLDSTASLAKRDMAWTRIGSLKGARGGRVSWSIISHVSTHRKWHTYRIDTLCVQVDYPSIAIVASSLRTQECLPCGAPVACVW